MNTITDVPMRNGERLFLMRERGGGVTIAINDWGNVACLDEFNNRSTKREKIDHTKIFIAQEDLKKVAEFLLQNT